MALSLWPGVHTVEIDTEKSELKVKGAIDPVKIQKRIEKISKRKVELISPKIKAKESVTVEKKVKETKEVSIINFILTIKFNTRTCILLIMEITKSNICMCLYLWSGCMHVWVSHGVLKITILYFITFPDETLSSRTEPLQLASHAPQKPSHFHFRNQHAWSPMRWTLLFITEKHCHSCMLWMILHTQQKIELFQTTWRMQYVTHSIISLVH